MQVLHFRPSCKKPGYSDPGQRDRFLVEEIRSISYGRYLIDFLFKKLVIWERVCSTLTFKFSWRTSLRTLLPGRRFKRGNPILLFNRLSLQLRSYPNTASDLPSLLTIIATEKLPNHWLYLTSGPGGYFRYFHTPDRWAIPISWYWSFNEDLFQILCDLDLFLVFSDLPVAPVADLPVAPVAAWDPHSSCWAG